MSIPTLPGIEARTVTTGRIRTRVLYAGPEDGVPVLFLHGNLSSATWWEETMVRLPDGFRAIAPDQRGYGDADPEAKIDATLGLGDLADDAVALLDHLGVRRAHLVGNSLGGVVVWRLLAAHPGRWMSVTQVDPGSPFGFGATRDVAGTPTVADFAGSGAGLINPEVVRLLAAGDESTDSPFSPRSVFRAAIVAPGFVAAREDDLVRAMISTHLGEHDYPGDAVPSPNWPYVAPGTWGPNNALSPKYTAEAEGVVGADPKPPVLWIRGAADLVVSDTSASDPGVFGPTGLIPGYPGTDAYPPQPMIGQIRAMLDRYRTAGGDAAEHVIDGAAHVPFIEQPGSFDEPFHRHLHANTTHEGGHE